MDQVIAAASSWSEEESLAPGLGGGEAAGADTYVVLTTVPGLLRDPNDPQTLIRQIPIEQFDMFVEEFARGRMKRKMAATLEALQGDVRHIVIADGRVDHPVRAALEGLGTVIRAEKPGYD